MCKEICIKCKVLPENCIDHIDTHQSEKKCINCNKFLIYNKCGNRHHNNCVINLIGNCQKSW